MKWTDVPTPVEVDLRDTNPDGWDRLHLSNALHAALTRGDIRVRDGRMQHRGDLDPELVELMSAHPDVVRHFVDRHEEDRPTPPRPPPHHRTPHPDKGGTHP